MISKLLNNISTLINYIVLFIILLILTYIIYKIFIIDNDIYIINEKINQIEMDMTTIPSSSSHELPKKQMYEMADLCMNKCFVEELAPTSIDIDINHIPKKNLNDNKKEEPLDLNIDKGETIKVASKKDSKSKSKIFKSIVIDISDDDE